MITFNNYEYYMRNKISMLVALTTVGLNTVTYAMPPRPANCPSASIIKAAGLTYSIQESSGSTYTVVQLNNYATKDKWLFGFASIKASSSQEALNIGNQLLATLYGAPQPVAITSENVWGCLYKTTKGDYGIALTPVDLSASLPRTLMASMH